MKTSKSSKHEQKGSDDESDEPDSDEEDDDAAEAALLAKMHAARMSEMKDLAAEKKANAQEQLGSHKRLAAPETLASLLEQSASIPVVLHIGFVSNDPSVDNNLVLVVAEELKRHCPRFEGVARLVTDVCIDPMELPAWLQAHTLPALVTLHHRAVTATLRERLREMPEPLVREAVTRWLASQRGQLARFMRGHAET